jgi:hypothetical protein
MEACITLGALTKRLLMFLGKIVLGCYATTFNFGSKLTYSASVGFDGLSFHFSPFSTEVKKTRAENTADFRAAVIEAACNEFGFNSKKVDWAFIERMINISSEFSQWYAIFRKAYTFSSNTQVSILRTIGVDDADIRSYLENQESVSEVYKDVAAAEKKLSQKIKLLREEHNDTSTAKFLSVRSVAADIMKYNVNDISIVDAYQYNLLIAKHGNSSHSECVNFLNASILKAQKVAWEHQNNNPGTYIYRHIGVISDRSNLPE